MKKEGECILLSHQMARSSAILSCQSNDAMSSYGCMDDALTLYAPSERGHITTFFARPDKIIPSFVSAGESLESGKGTPLQVSHPLAPWSRRHSGDTHRAAFVKEGKRRKEENKFEVACGKTTIAKPRTAGGAWSTHAMELLYRYHFLMSQAAEYRRIAMHPALTSMAPLCFPANDPSWDIVAQCANAERVSSPPLSDMWKEKSGESVTFVVFFFRIRRIAATPLPSPPSLPLNLCLFPLPSHSTGCSLRETTHH